MGTVLNWLRGRSLRAKLALGFASMIALTATVGVISAVGQFRSRAAMQRLLDQEVRVAELVLNTKATLQLSRRYERDFLNYPKSLTFDEAKARYVILVQSHAAEIHDNMTAIRALTRSAESTRLTRLIDEAVSQCEKSFLKLVSLAEQRRRGDNGLESRLANQAILVEAAARKTELDRLLLDNFVLHAAKDAYLLNNYDKEIRRFQDAVAALRKDVKETVLDLRDQQKLLASVDDYQSFFQQLVQINSQSGAELETYLALTHTVEPLLQHLHDCASQAERAIYADVRRLAQTILWTTLGTMLMATALGGLVAHFLSREITGGVGECIEFAKRVARGDLTARLLHPGQDEFGSLAAGLSDMASQLEQTSASLRRANEQLELRVQERTRDLVRLEAEIADRKRAEAERDRLHQQLVESARLAGMAEVATGVLHNVGNVLNSVNVASACVAESIRKSDLASLSKVIALLRQHEVDLGEFLSQDPKGKRVVEFLGLLAEHLAAEQATALKELRALEMNIEHIKEIVSIQQNYANPVAVRERLSVGQLVEDALTMNASSLVRRKIKVVREFGPQLRIILDRHKVLQILVNLVRNAIQACDEPGRPENLLTVRVTNGGDRVRIAVVDTGVGIAPENLTRIFHHGFTTKENGHGFGLHSGAIAAKQMGGSLLAQSDGPGRGASFTLELLAEPATPGS